MQRTWLLVGLWTVAAAGCSKPASSQADVTAPEAAVSAPAPAAAKSNDPKAGDKGAEAPRPGSVTPMLAYTYDYTIEAPTASVAPLLGRHEAACRAAGPELCQVVAATDEIIGRDRTTGKLQLRAEPRWLDMFRSRLDGDAKSAGGKLIHSAIATEDLTRQIVDTDAAIRARNLLRGRLEQLLATRPGKLSELIELEQELARVQGEIDAAQSEVNVMRSRVAMSSVTLEYDSQPPLTNPGALRPLDEALRGFVGNVAQGLAAVVTLVSYLLPFALAGALVYGSVLWIRRRRRQASPASLQMPRSDDAPPSPD